MTYRPILRSCKVLGVFSHFTLAPFLLPESITRDFQPRKMGSPDGNTKPLQLGFGVYFGSEVRPKLAIYLGRSIVTGLRCFIQSSIHCFEMSKMQMTATASTTVTARRPGTKLLVRSLSK